MPVPVLWGWLFFAVLAARCSGDDPKLPGPFPILSSPVAGFWAGLGFGVTAVAVVAVGGRKRGFALDAAQHDQVDEAAIPALLGQVTARKGMCRITDYSPRGARILPQHPNMPRPMMLMHFLRQLITQCVDKLGHLEAPVNSHFLQYYREIIPAIISGIITALPVIRADPPQRNRTTGKCHQTCSHHPASRPPAWQHRKVEQKKAKQRVVTMGY